MGISGTSSFLGVGISGTRSPFGGEYVQRGLGTHPPSQIWGLSGKRVVRILHECFPDIGSGIQAGGTHPSGMFSSLFLLFYRF